MSAWLQLFSPETQPVATVTAAVVAAVMSLIVTIMTLLAKPFADRNLAAFQARLAKTNNEGLESLKSSLQKTNNEDLETLKAELQDSNAQKLETLKADLQYVNGKTLETFKSELLDENAARNARREYEFEARKRLYQEIEPLLFQLNEAAEEAFYRVKSLTRSARRDELKWLRGKGYYLRSTVHKLFVPAVVFRVVQRQMTFIDLRLDETIRTKYYLMKLYAYSFTDDFDIANRIKQRHPDFEYDPNEGTREMIQSDPARYARQGLYVGVVENTADAMIKEYEGKEHKGLRPKAFGEYWDSVKLDDSMPGDIKQVVSLYSHFDSRSNPILAHILHAQACIARLILLSSGGLRQNLHQALTDFISSSEFQTEFAWAEGTKPDTQLVLTYIEGTFHKIAGRELRSVHCGSPLGPLA
jgi:hypothetical protein